MKPSILLLFCVAAAVMFASAQTPAAKTGLTKTELRKLFEETQWLMAGNAEFKGAVGTYVFRRDGSLTNSGAVGGKSFPGKFYGVEAPDILKIYQRDPKRDRQSPFMLFHVNAAAMTAEQDTGASTISGSNFMKYEGPAKRVK